MKVEIAFISVTWMQLLSVLQNSVRPLSLYKSTLISPYSSAVAVETLLTNSLVTKSQIQCTSFKYSFVLERDACGGRTFYLMMCAGLSPSGPLPLQLPGRHVWEVLFWTFFSRRGWQSIYCHISYLFSASGMPYTGLRLF